MMSTLRGDTGLRSMITIHLPTSLENRLEKLAQRSGRPTSKLIREAVMRYVQDAEDVQRAERTLRRVRAGLERTYPMDEVAERLGLDR